MSSILLNKIRSRVCDRRNNKNYIGVICGETGSGKSFAAMSMLEKIDPTFNIDRVNFYAESFINSISSGLKKGNSVLWDETGVGLSSKQWFTIVNKTINWVLQTFRRDNLIVMFTTPNLNYIDKDSRRLLHAYFEVSGISKSKKLCYIKPFEVSTNPKTGVTYYKYPKVHGNKIKRMAIDLPSKELVDQYEEKKKLFTEALKSGALQTIQKYNTLFQKKPTDEEQQIMKEYEEGTMTQAQIGTKYGMGQKAISRIIAKCRDFVNSQTV